MIGDEYHLRLTEYGAHEAFRLQVLQAKPMPDHCVCMVIFDIPEHQRKLRRSLRGFLSYAGFTQLQKSVWTAPFDAWKPLVKLFHIDRSSKWVSVFIAREMDIS
jgi:DNA-binding transcriptional regulator PaaX